MSETPNDLTRRIELLEQDVASLRAAFPAAPVMPAAPPPAPHAAPQAASQPAAVPPAPAPRRRRTSEDEVRVVGTWLARIGAVAVLVGGGFAYSYAVDRGLIGPAARVSLGILVGLAFAITGEWARTREWPGWAQAVAGGAVGIWYLAIWAAAERYSLIDAPTALGALSIVTVGAVALALRHGSEPLAVLATLGALVNPFVVGVDGAVALLSYVLLVDVGATILSAVGPWRSLQRVALAGTWLAALVTEVPDLSIALGFATAFAFLFTSALLVPVIAGRRPASVDDAGALVASSGAYALYCVSHLLGDGDLVGPFVILLGALHLALAALLSPGGERTGPITRSLAGIGAALLVAAVPLQLDGPAVAAVWTAQALALLVVSRVTGSPGAAAAGLGLLGFTIAETLVFEFALGAFYDPARPFVSGESALLVLQIGALAAAARLVDGALASLRSPLILSAHVLALTWMTFEVGAAASGAQAATFGTTAVWALYAVGLVIAGLGLRSTLSRRTAVAVFAAVVVKLVVSDLWLLETLYRTVAFVGLGVLLLASSLLFYRFRDFLVDGSDA